ncbi:hypothetical protein EUGRSUZ_C03171 [Eucalyptus grandis]|uniref:Uncharacterized protein n=2 Tax=Eucalyptus grandis TaxID=71139 RepID=A0ACC3LI71_EUCGR|nr:hypothetical protein EUGRSUZ_C03171 [Eucalyptus grandis]
MSRSLHYSPGNDRASLGSLPLVGRQLSWADPACKVIIGISTFQVKAFEILHYPIYLQLQKYLIVVANHIIGQYHARRAKMLHRTFIWSSSIR